jgi:drug/metabolite transporter (DMT)-like permease
LAVAVRGNLWESLCAPQGWDWVWLVLLATVCTAYAFIQSVKVMQHLSPFTVMLTINLEPVYGIALAFLVLGENEQLSGGFYVGALWLFASVLGHTWIKRPRKRTSN